LSRKTTVVPPFQKSAIVFFSKEIVNNGIHLRGTGRVAWWWCVWWCFVQPTTFGIVEVIPAIYGNFSDSQPYKTLLAKVTWEKKVFLLLCLVVSMVGIGDERAKPRSHIEREWLRAEGGRL